MLASDHQAKVLSWRKQSGALSSPFYRVTLIGRSGSAEGKTINLGKPREPDAQEHFYTAEEVEDLIPDLRRRNARGFDIYITPIDPHHHFVVIDDMKPGATACLENLGYRPCLVQTSSLDNEQAVLKVPRVDRLDEQSLANKVVQDLNRQLGDPKFSGVVHPFRMAGFSNKKEGRHSAFTRVLLATHRICAKAGEWLQGLRDAVGGAKPQRADSRKVVSGETAYAHTDDLDAVAAFAEAAERVRGWVRARGLVEDESRIDYRACLSMLQAGWPPARVADGLLGGSADLHYRHKDPLDYVQRTVRKASDEYVNSSSQRASTPPADGSSVSPRPRG